MRSLAEVLQAELEVVRELLNACRQEQAALVADDLAAIQQAVAVKGELAWRLATLEQERQQVPARHPGTVVRPRSLSATSQVPEIKALRDALQQAVRELQEVNETNRFLARQSLAYAQKMLALLMPEGTAPGLMDRVV